MKRQKRRIKTAKSRNDGGSTDSAAPRKPASRRNFLKTLRDGALITGVVGGGAWYLVAEVSATIGEQDLSRIGNGIPAVVQIHDPQCQQCQALQREARDAIASFDDGELQFLVANIRQAKGRRLAAAHGVGHVTLLLFDGDGRRRSVLSGPNTSENLEHAFRRFLALNGSS